jgi:hypothetical protein
MAASTVVKLVAASVTVSFGSLVTVDRLPWAHGTHYTELRQSGMVTAPWKLLGATHLQRVMRCDLVDDSCAV